MPDSVVRFWAVVPAKDPARAKSRLAPVLPQSARRELALRLLEHTLAVLAAVPGGQRRQVISAADEPLEMARRQGAMALREAPPLLRQRPGAWARTGEPTGESGEPALNAALDQAARHAIQHGADALLILPADLPLLDSPAVLALVARLDAPRGVVLVPDRLHSGTNALLLRPPRALPFQFGAESFQRHRASARQLGVPLQMLEQPALALDLDTPEDLALFLERSGGTLPAGGPVSTPFCCLGASDR
jgi:2-phospho-L-lactate guanylyltransferase